MDERGLVEKIDVWVAEGLISPEQAQALKEREAVVAPLAQRKRGIRADEIFVYLGALVVFLALAFLVGFNWGELQSWARILSLAAPTALLLGLGWWLRGLSDPRLQRGAQAMWLVGCLMAGWSLGVALSELSVTDDETLIYLLSSLFGLLVSGAAYVLLPKIPQSIVFHLWGCAVLLIMFPWFEEISGPNPWRALLLILIFGGAWLALDAWLRKRDKQNLAAVARLFGTFTILAGTTVLMLIDHRVKWHSVAFDVLPLLACITFIAASIWEQSQVFLFSSVGFLLFWVIFITFERFAEEIGMPLAMLVIGVLFIGVGLGAGRLSQRFRTDEAV